MSLPFHRRYNYHPLHKHSRCRDAMCILLIASVLVSAWKLCDAGIDWLARNQARLEYFQMAASVSQAVMNGNGYRIVHNPDGNSDTITKFRQEEYVLAHPIKGIEPEATGEKP